MIADVLKAVFGSPADPQHSQPDLDAQLDRAAFYALKAEVARNAQ
jgi:hypothetical protein